MTLYQDQIAHSPDVRAALLTNRAFSRRGENMPLQVVDRLCGWLWLGFDGSSEGLWDACEMLRIHTKGACTVESVPADSLAVPFRGSIRSAFSSFIRMKTAD